MIAYLALGSNMGDRLALLKQARQRLTTTPGITVLASSKLYETAPYGYLDQADFLNAVVKIETSLTPQKLLATIHEIEADLDRVRKIHWGPRTIDIDILLMGDLTLNEADLVIPHQELTKRSFVLIPLKDVHPANLFDRSLAEWIKQTGNQTEVRLAKEEW